MINKINQKASTIARILAVLASYVRRFKRDSIERIFLKETNILSRNTATPREG